MNPKIPKPAAAILDFISQFESRGNYLAYFGHSTNKHPLPGTVAGVLTFMEQMTSRSHEPSSATGRYQFMWKTLEGLVKKHNIPSHTPFTNDLQDLLGYYLLEERGYTSWAAGHISSHEFADELSMEWASLPYHTGKSYYDGDGLNHSLVTREHFIATLVKAKEEQEVA